jgi:hypothetical protein
VNVEEWRMRRVEEGSSVLSYRSFLWWQTRDVNAFTVPAKTADHAICDSASLEEERPILLHCDLSCKDKLCDVCLKGKASRRAGLSYGTL